MMPIKRSLTLEAMSVKDQTEDEKRALEIEELKKMIEKLQQTQQSMKEKVDNLNIHHDASRGGSQSPR